MVQHTAARWVLSWHDPTSSVTDMPSELKWRTLEQRRGDTALTMLYKIRNGHLLTSPTYLTPVTGILARAHPHHYVQNQTDTLVQGYSFSGTPYDCGMRFLTLWPWLRRPTPSGIEWARCSTRPETKPPPAMSPRAPPPAPRSPALTAYDTGSARGSPLYPTNHPTLRLINNLQLIPPHPSPHYLSLLSIPFYYLSPSCTPLLLTNTLTYASLPPPHGHNAQDWAGSITGR